MRVVIFDLFDTLIEKKWFDFSKIIDFLVNEIFIGVDRLKLVKATEEYREKFMMDRDRTNIETSFVDQLKYYENKLGLKINQDYYEVEWQAFKLSREDTVACGAESVLKYLKFFGYRLGVLSNSIFSTKTLIRYLDSFALSNYFEKIISSADIGYRKPSSQAFNKIINELGVTNSDTFFVGNKWDKDVVGALNSGLKAVYLNKNQEFFAKEKSVIEVSSLVELEQYFSKAFVYVNSIMQRESLVDGPGLRTVVFLQGCTKKCKGCHSPYTSSHKEGTRLYVSELAELLKKKALNKKITISGGEPLEQKRALIELLDLLKGYDLCLYTSEEFPNVDESIINKLNYIKVGAYDEKLHSCSMPYVGSTNQKFIKVDKKNEAK